MMAVLPCLKKTDLLNLKIIKIKDGASYQDARLRRGTKEKEAKEKELLLAKEKAEKEKAKLDAMAAALDKKAALAEEKEQRLTLQTDLVC